MCVCYIFAVLQGRGQGTIRVAGTRTKAEETPTLAAGSVAAECTPAQADRTKAPCTSSAPHHLRCASFGCGSLGSVLLLVACTFLSALCDRWCVFPCSV